MARLTADFSAAFSRDIKKKARKRGWDLSELEKVIDLVVENIPDSLETLRRRHNMHALWGAGRVGRSAMSPTRATGSSSGPRTTRLPSSSGPEVTTSYSDSKHHVSR